MQGNFWRLIAIVAIALILAENLTIAQTAADEDLITMAHKKFTEFSSDEEKNAFETFFQKTQDGKPVDLKPEVKIGNDPQYSKIFTEPVYADLWGKEQALKAEWLKWLCTDPKASAKISSSGIDIAHAKIVGNLNLSWVKMQFPLQTWQCAFTDSINLDWASLRGLTLGKAYIVGANEKALSGDGLTVDGDVDFSEFDAQKPVSLRNAKIGGDFCAHAAHFKHGRKTWKECSTGESTVFLDDPVPALDLTTAKIGSDVNLVNATSRGEVRLAGAEIDGSLRCQKGIFDGTPEDPEARRFHAIFGSSMKVAGDVFFSNGFVAKGPVALIGSTIGGKLDCSGGNFDGGPVALKADSVKVGDDLLVGQILSEGTLRFFAANIGGALVLNSKQPIKGTLIDLRDAKARILTNPKRSWPETGNLLLQGFVFNEIADTESDTESLNAETQVGWLRLQPKILNVQTQPQRPTSHSGLPISAIEWPRLLPRYLFIAQPYEQMATVFRNMGLEEEGVDVNIAENRDAGWMTIRNDFRAIVSNSMAIGSDGVKWRYGKVFIDQWEWLQAIIELFYDILWYWIFGPLIGYGYRPWNALFISLGFIGVGTGIFRFAAANGVLVQKDNRDRRNDHGGQQQLPEPDHRDRNFSAFIYSLETFVPLVKLGVAEYWLINANVVKPVQLGKVTLRWPGIPLLWYYRTHIIAGWVLTSLWVAAFAGILKH